MDNRKGLVLNIGFSLNEPAGCLNRREPLSFSFEGSPQPIDPIDTARSSRCAGLLHRHGDRRLYAAQLTTDWGKRNQRLFAMTKNQELLASAQQYDLAGVLDGAQVRICGIGSVMNYQPQHDYRRQLVDTLLQQAARGSAQIGLVFWDADRAKKPDDGVDVVRFTDAAISVAESLRHGAPMTTVRSGGPRDLDCRDGKSPNGAVPVSFRSRCRFRPIRY